jgi:ABC-type amino acid transport system permease subunit
MFQPLPYDLWLLEWFRIEQTSIRFVNFIISIRLSFLWLLILRFFNFDTLTGSGWLAAIVITIVSETPEIVQTLQERYLLEEMGYAVSSKPSLTFSVWTANCLMAVSQ